MTVPQPEQIISVQVSNMTDTIFTVNDNDIGKSIERIQLYDRSAANLIWNIQQKIFSSRDKKELSMMKKFYDGRKKGSILGKRPATYSLSKTIPGKLGFGRYYGGDGSLETIESDIRATLAHKLYYDVDMVNCHPTLIPQLAKRLFNMDTPCLQHYVDNREGFFKTMKEEYGISEAEVKNKIISLIYSGVRYKKTDDIPNELIAIKKETDKVAQKLIMLAQSNPAYESLNKLYSYYVKGDDNPQGGFFSMILQTLERHCLNAILEKGMELGLTIDVLCYDGVMIRQEVDGVKVEITSEILTQLENAIYEKTGWHIKLKVKPMIPMDLDELASDNTDEYQKMKTRFEENHFYFKPTDSVCEMTDEGLFHYKIGHAMNAFNTSEWVLSGVNKDGEKDTFIKRWLFDASRKMIDKLVFKMPNECESNEISLFMGFRYEKLNGTYDEEAVTFFKDLVSACCGDEEPAIDYITKTFAHMIKKPFEKTGVCCIFSSHKQGCGKDTLLNWVGSVLGKHTVAHYVDTDTFWDKHNTGLEGAILCHLEEACAGANKANSDKLKARITADDLMLNPKGLKLYYIPNICRYFMTTNHADPVKIEETDRRFFLMNPSERLASIEWDTYQKNIRTDNWIYSIGKYLETIDVEDWNPRKFPITEIKKFIQEESKTSEARFLEVWNESSEREDRSWDNENITGATLYNYYKSYCQENSLPFLQSSISFTKKISAYKGKLFLSEMSSAKKMNLYRTLEKVTASA